MFVKIQVFMVLYFSLLLILNCWCSSEFMIKICTWHIITNLFEIKIAQFSFLFVFGFAFSKSDFFSKFKHGLIGHIIIFHFCNNKILKRDEKRRGLIFLIGILSCIFDQPMSIILFYFKPGFFNIKYWYLQNV